VVLANMWVVSTLNVRVLTTVSVGRIDHELARDKE
jgi:hypothetical protein